MRSLRQLAKDALQTRAALQLGERLLKAGHVLIRLLVADGARHLDEELKPVRRLRRQATEHLRARWPVESEIQFHQREMPAIVLQHASRSRAGRIETANPIRIGIPGSADPDLHGGW